MASGHKTPKGKQHPDSHKHLSEDALEHPHAIHDVSQHSGHQDLPKENDEESITISSRTLIIGLVVVLAVALVIWKFQAVPPPEAAAPTDADSLKPAIDDEVVAKVNGEEIYRSRIQHQLDQLPLEMKGAISFDEILNASINEAILLQQAKRLGVDVSDAEANAYFTMSLNTSGVSREELLDRASKRGIDEGEIIGIFRRRLIVNELLQVAVFPSINVSDAEAKGWYEENKGGLGIPETVEAKHILLAQPEEANATLERIKKGNSFEELAKDLSLDRASAVNGGDLGNFTKGMMIPEFEDAAWEAKAGAIVGPVKTQFGYHIIKVIAHHKGRERPFSELKDIIIKKLKSDRSEAAANDYVAGLRAQADVVWLSKPSDSRPAPGFPSLEDLDEEQ